MNIFEYTFEKHKKLMLESLIEKEIPNGRYYHVDDVTLNRTFRGKGIGKKMYQILLTCMPNDTIGLLSRTGDKLSTASNVSSIYKSLGGNIGIKGSKDTYDVVFLKNFNKVKLYYPELKSNELIHRETIGGDEFIFKMREYPNPIIIDVYSKNLNTMIGMISATKISWDSKTEDFDFD